MTSDTSLSTVSNIDKAIANIADINTIPDARKLIALAQGYVETARKLYNASTITSIIEAGEDKNKSHDIAMKAGELKLYAEKRLGELIKSEQEAGRLATQAIGINQYKSGYSTEGMPKTLSDYNLTAKDSYHAQQLADHPEILAEVIVNSLDIPTRAAVEKEIKKREIETRNDLPTPPLPVDLFNVIYADPPWKYDFSQSDSREIENQYPTMELDKIKSLVIPAADDTVLLLWATAPKLREALEVIAAWGFIYKTHAVWDKQKIGMGYWFRGQHEDLLVAVKGNFSPPAPDRRFSSVISDIRTDHSVKPIAVYDMIEHMFPLGKYLELFARQKHNEKWHAWGNQC